MSRELLTPKQVARAIGVSESSLKRWCDEGAIITTRTPGGHRRLPLGSVLEFIRRNDYRLVSPEALGLPPTCGQTDRVLTRGRELLVEALVRGDEQACRQVIFDLYLARHRISMICDQVVTGAFEDIGNLWDCGQVEVYQERRGCQLMGRVLNELEAAIPFPKGDVKQGLGGTFSGDYYSLPTAMVELVLRDNGWQACSLGCGLPIETMRAAIEDNHPDLFWLSVTHLESVEEFLSSFPRLYSTARECGTRLVVGGQALTQEIREQLEYSSFCDHLQHMEAFLREIS